MKTRGKPLKFGSQTKKVGVVVPLELWTWAKEENIIFSDLMYKALSVLQAEYETKDTLNDYKIQNILPIWEKYRFAISKKYPEIAVNGRCPYLPTDSRVNPYFKARGIIISNKCLFENWLNLKVLWGDWKNVKR